MAPFKKKQKATAEIQLAPKADGNAYSSDPEHFLSDEIVTGYAVFKLLEGVNCSHVKITMKGSIKTITEDTVPGSVSKSWRTEQLPFLGVLFEKNSRNGLEGENGSIRVPFRFKLSECEKLAAFISSLPPSVDSRSEGQRSHDPQYEITYNITATAFSSHGSLATATQKIFIDTVSSDSLSDASSDVPGEYFWATKSITRSKSVQTPSTGPRIELAGQEPPSIVLNAEDVESDGGTEVPFIVKISPQKGAKESLPSTCRAKAQLSTKTHMTPDGIKGITSSLSLDYIKIEGKQTTKVQYNHQQDHAIPIARWERSLGESTEAFAVARFSLPFKLEGGKLPLPSFYTPILSRRYMIDLTLSFDGFDDTFKLSLPVEIVHGTDYDSDSDDIKKSKDEASFVSLSPARTFERRATAT